MRYGIFNEYGDLVKETGKEVLIAHKGDAIVVNDVIYIVDNKHIDYDEDIVKVWVETDK